MKKAMQETLDKRLRIKRKKIKSMMWWIKVNAKEKKNSK